MQDFMSKDEMQSKVISFLGDDNGILLRKSEWQVLKQYLNKVLTDEQKEKVYGIGIEELEFASPQS